MENNINLTRQAKLEKEIEALDIKKEEIWEEMENMDEDPANDAKYFALEDQLSQIDKQLKGKRAVLKELNLHINDQKIMREANLYLHIPSTRKKFI